MTKTAVAAPAPADPADELCHCDHERKWHDACSRCDCPWFLVRGNTGPLKRWRRDRQARRAQEAR